jgi:hypothetical protein
MKRARNIKQKLVLNTETIVHLKCISLHDLDRVQGGETATGITEDINKCSNNSFCTKPG